MSRKNLRRLLARRRKNALKPMRAAARKSVYSRLAAAIVAPLMARRNYSSFARQVFIITCLDCGLSPEDGLRAGCGACIVANVLLS